LLPTIKIKTVPAQLTKQYALYAQWRDQYGNIWETRSGPYRGDPIPYFQDAGVIILVDPKDQRMSVREL